jgi:hypothetical protein
MSEDGASDFRNVEKALRLVRAYGVKPVRAQDNPEYQAELRKLTEHADDVEKAREWGRVVQGLTILCNVLISGLAERTGTTRDQVIDAYALQTEGLINQLKGDLGALGAETMPVPGIGAAGCGLFRFGYRRTADNT